MLNSAGLSTEQYARMIPLYNEMRVELMAGQFLDIHEQTQKDTDTERSMKIARYKSGKYTIERPLHLGAALAIKNPAERKELTNILSAYGLPLGEAFQLRDDMLGIFGDPSVTGKPAGDDIREGKRTVLMAMTFERADQQTKAKLSASLGREDLTSADIEEVRALITATGAVKDVEDLIDGLLSNALTAANSGEIAPSARELLVELATSAIRRSH
jgi:geranylgeranyl diphosphate synthase type I